MKRRSFSKRDQGYVEHLALEICRGIGLDIRDPDCRHECIHIGWEGFLEVYQNQPGSFRGTGWRGWDSAAKVMWEKLSLFKRAMDTVRYRESSLNQRVSEEIPVMRLELLPAKIGDFQNHVCFWDYVGRLPREASFMASRLSEGDTLEEIQQIYHWPPEQVRQVFGDLREAMQAYQEIDGSSG